MRNFTQNDNKVVLHNTYLLGCSVQRHFKEWRRDQLKSDWISYENVKDHVCLKCKFLMKKIEEMRMVSLESPSVLNADGAKNGVPDISVK